MKQRHDDKKKGMQVAHADPEHRSPLELLRRSGGKARRVQPKQGRPLDSMLAVYKEKITYTFILEEEVASIHFDRSRGEIFFKGHNIRHLTLTEPQRMALYQMQEVMAEDPRASALISDYAATLARALADN